MKKSIILLALLSGGMAGMQAQTRPFAYKFYGQVRADLFYNSRSNSETVDGLFYMYPKDVLPDANGEDRNDYANGGLYTLYSRLGVDVTGPLLGDKIRTSAKVEVDFRGSGTNYSFLRLRHAYFDLDWGKSALRIGQAWHPLYGDVAPSILNLNTGAPYQPFSRAPQIRYRYTGSHLVATAAAVWQSQYLSVGPSSNVAGMTATAKSQNFLKNSCIPELYAGLDYKTSGFLVGAGVHVSSVVPRTESVVDVAGTTTQAIYKVNERITSVSGEAHLKYADSRWLVAAKSVLGSNLTQTSSVGGYGITAIDVQTGKQDYTPLRTSSSWLNVLYGRKWRGGIFAGYIKNLGAGEDVKGVLGTGTNIDRLTTATAELTYNIPHWKFGAEYSWVGAWYGTNNEKGKVADTHLVKNNRILFTALFMF